MKKLVLVLCAVGASIFAWRKYNENSSERDLWSEVTDTLD